MTTGQKIWGAIVTLVWVIAAGLCAWDIAQDLAGHRAPDTCPEANVNGCWVQQ